MFQRGQQIVTEQEINQVYYLGREIDFNSNEVVLIKKRINLKKNDSACEAEVGYLNAIVCQLEERNEKCAVMREKIFQYIDEIEDDFMRQVFKCRYMKRMSWEATALKNGGYNTPNALREMVQRYLKAHKE